MFITKTDLKSVLYEYQLNQIAENNDAILEDGIAAAITEVRSYFDAANARRETAGLSKQEYAAWKLYDTDVIFSATGTNRDSFVMRLCMRIAAYNICELANVDVLDNHVRERYESTIKTLEKIAGLGEYAQNRIVLSDLPSPTPSGDDDSSTPSKPFRMVSRPKFHHE